MKTEYLVYNVIVDFQETEYEVLVDSGNAMVLAIECDD